MVDNERAGLIRSDCRAEKRNTRDIAAQNLSGAMFWELSQDEGPLLDALRSGLESTAR